MNRKIRLFIILFIACVFLFSTAQGLNVTNEQKECDVWWQNYDVIFDNVVYGNGTISFTLNNTGAEEINIRHIGVNYESRGPVTGEEANITLKPHSGRFIEIPTDKEPNRIVILTDRDYFFTGREGALLKACEEIAKTLQTLPAGGWTGSIKTNKPLQTILPIMLTLIFFLILLFSIINFKTIRKAFSKISKKTWIILALIFLFGFVLRMWIVPHIHYIYFDEDMYLDMGKNIAETGKAYVCDYYSSGQCLSSSFYPMMAVGFPFILALVFKLFGTSHTAAFSASAFFGSLSIILIFFVAYLLFKKEEIGLWSALVLCLSPTLIKWSGSAMPEATSLFFILLSLLAFLLYSKLKSLKILFFSFCILAFTLQFRLEYIILLPFLAFLFNNKGKKIFEWKFLIIFLLFLLLILPQLLFVYNAYFKNLIATRPGPLAREILPFQPASFLGKFASNLKFWVDWNYNIPLFSLFSLIGAFYLLKKKKIFSFLVGFFLVFIVIYSVYQQASLILLKQTRYFMPTYIPFAIFGGYGLYSLFKGFLKQKAYVYLVIGCVLLSFSFYLSHLTEKEVRVSDDTVMNTYHQIPNNSTIVTSFPFIFSFLGKNAVRLDVFLENQTLREEVFNQASQVIFFKDEECLSGAPLLWPYKTSSRPLCEEISRKHNLSPIITDEEGCFFSLYEQYWRRWVVLDVKCGYYLLNR